jgi:predicted metal-binding membrane protein
MGAEQAITASAACPGLMAALFALGVMSLVWMAAITG